MSTIIDLDFICLFYKFLPSMSIAFSSVLVVIDLALDIKRLKLNFSTRWPGIRKLLLWSQELLVVLD